MTIADLRTHVVSAPLHAPFVTAARRTDVVDAVLVEVVDSDGRAGWGEGVATWRITGDSVPGISAALDGPLRATVIGADADDLEPLLRRVAASIVGNTAAKAGLDAALHDLAARRAGVSLPRFLGTSATTVATDVTITVDTPDGMAAAAARRVAEGFDVLKVKVGDGGADELARLRGIRESAGPQAILRLDANQGWAPREAVRIISAIEDAGLDVELVEQPVAAGDLDGLAYVCARVATPVLADEAVWSPQDLLRVIHRRAADAVNVKLAKCGGLRAARQLLAVAEAAGVGVLVGSMMETHVGVGAAASFAATVPPAYVHDLDAAWWLAAPPVRGGISYAGPTLRLPVTAGSGITGLPA